MMMGNKNVQVPFFSPFSFCFSFDKLKDLFIQDDIHSSSISIVNPLARHFPLVLFFFFFIIFDLAIIFLYASVSIPPTRS
jgi:hypothetical protein